MACISPGSIPVSYTHLDVYKRQPYKNVLAKIYKVDGYEAGDSDPAAYVAPASRGPESMTDKHAPLSYEAKHDDE